jgi:hypothetical protein
MKNVMVDLETRGNVPGCIYMSLGAVAFDLQTGEMDAGIYHVVHLRTAMEAFLFEQADTMTWWKKQEAAARKVLEECEDPAVAISLTDSLRTMNAYVIKHGGFKDCKVWGNGSDFDNAILASAYEAVKMKPAWAFWNNRCYRTWKNLPGAPALKRREGTYHNALDDARTQAVHLIEINRSLFNGGN